MNNLSGTITVILIGLIGGVAVGLQGPMSGAMSQRLGPLGSSLIIHLGGAIDEASGTKRLFVLMAGIGLDASVVRGVRPRLKKRIGKGAFWISGLSHLADWKPNPFTLEIEGRSYSGTFAAIGNAPRYGGDLAITPGARLDQPEFEICIIDTLSRLRYLRCGGRRSFRNTRF